VGVEIKWFAQILFAGKIGLTLVISFLPPNHAVSRKKKKIQRLELILMQLTNSVCLFACQSVGETCGNLRVVGEIKCIQFIKLKGYSIKTKNFS
jgi:hypothetical protein